MTFWRLFTNLEMGISFVCLDHSKMRLLPCLGSYKDILLPDSAGQPPQIGSRHFSPDMQDNASLVAGNEDGYLSIFPHL